MASGGEGRRRVSRWSDDSDLLDLIVKKLTRASDYLRFRCVCKSWRSTAKPTDFPPHVPLLILHYDPSTERRSVLSVSTQQIRTLSIPELVNKVILAASRGWLLLLDVAPADGRLFLLNPVTGAHVQLPPTDGFYHLPGYEFSPAHQKFLSIRYGLYPTLDLLQYSRIFPWRAFLLSSPSAAPRDCMVVIAECYSRDHEVAICKLGDESWTVMDTGLFGLPVSVAHHGGSLYMTDTDGNASVCEIASPLSPELIDLPYIEGEDVGPQFFVATSSQLLLFARYDVDDDSDDEDEHCDVEYFKICYAIFEFMWGNPPGWSPVKSIQGNAVFRSWDRYQNFIVCTRDAPGCQGDSVYFSEPIDFSRDERDALEIDVLDLKTSKCEHLLCGRREPHSKKLLHPVWFELSLC